MSTAEKTRASLERTIARKFPQLEAWVELTPYEREVGVRVRDPESERKLKIGPIRVDSLYPQDVIDAIEDWLAEA